MLIEKDNCYLSAFHSFFFLNFFFLTFLLKRAVTGFPKKWKGRASLPAGCKETSEGLIQTERSTPETCEVVGSIFADSWISWNQFELLCSSKWRQACNWESGKQGLLPLMVESPWGILSPPRVGRVWINRIKSYFCMEKKKENNPSTVLMSLKDLKDLTWSLRQRILSLLELHLPSAPLTFLDAQMAFLTQLNSWEGELWALERAQPWKISRNPLEICSWESPAHRSRDESSSRHCPVPV